MERQYRAALIGCGGRAPAHIEAYQLLENAEVVACCAPTPTRRDPLAERYRLRAYDSAETMIREESPDLVHIVTWPDTRIDLMQLVSSMGVPLCTVEKPVASGVSDWRILQELATTSATKFAICHQFRWQPDVMRCQEALQSGALGKPLFLDISAGMNIAGQGTHTLNYGRSLVGDACVTDVFASAKGWDDVDPGHPAPAATEAFLTFENGVRALWTSGDISPRCGDPSTTWQHVRMAVYTEYGRTLYEEFGKWEIVTPAGIEHGDYGGWDGWRKNNKQAQANFHQAMIDWLSDDTKRPGTHLAASLHEWEVVLALYQSALERRPVSLSGFAPPADLVSRLKANLSKQV